MKSLIAFMRTKNGKAGSVTFFILLLFTLVAILDHFYPKPCQLIGLWLLAIGAVVAIIASLFFVVRSFFDN